jgi:hypothetical protein
MDETTPEQQQNASADADEQPARETLERCVCCGRPTAVDGAFLKDLACRRCRRRLPPALVKAVGDRFQYACRLRTGDIVRFTGAEIRGAYATLELDTQLWPGDPAREVPYPFPRGLDVRIEDIVWCGDAPEGS